ncbi:MAG: hypothetical protein WBE74_24220, partial [Terracidiphilus sp.]
PGCKQPVLFLSRSGQRENWPFRQLASSLRRWGPSGHGPNFLLFDPRQALTMCRKSALAHTL